MDTDLISLARETVESVNDRDIDGALSHFAGDATVSVPGIPDERLHASGKRDIRQRLLSLFDENIHLEPRNFREIGDTVIWNANLHIDELATEGFDRIPVEYEAKFDGELIKSLTVRMSEEGMKVVAETLRSRLAYR